MYRQTTRLAIALTLLLIASPAAPAQTASQPRFDILRDDLVIADFEAENYGAWTATGAAFGKAPAKGTLPGQMHVEGYEGKGLVNSFLGGDDAIGALTSPAVKLDRKYINFLIGGGGWKDETCLQLKVAGKIVRTKAGPNTNAGGSERLDWASFDVAEFAGKEAVIEIVDSRKGGWGHINVDQITQSDAKKEVGPAKLKLEVAGRYLWLPSKRGAPNNRLKVIGDGKALIDCDIQLSADAQPGIFSVDLWEGGKTPPKVVEIEIERIASDSPILTGGWRWFSTFQGNPDPKLSQPPPRFHFAARRGWLNDPNGMVYHDGKYHLYFQHNPFGSEWGNMHWGHAVSTNLLKWEELPIAIKPPKHGDWAFSGSAMIDAENRSGWGTKENPPIVAAWTSTGRGECISYSTDGGVTFKEFEGNPVVKHQGRDPRILWHEQSKQFVMAVYEEVEGKQWIAFYNSPDLKKWTFTSKIEGYFECPELFPLTVEGANHAKWIMYAADGEYVVGEFDGKVFKPETKKQRVWYGSFYASQTFSNAPNGRRIQIGWARGIDPRYEVYNQQMNVPVELKLKFESNGYLLSANPVTEIEAVTGKVTKIGAVELEKSERMLADPPYTVIDTQIDFARLDGVVELNLLGNRIRLSTKEKTIECEGAKAPLTFGTSPVRVRALLDMQSIEVFVNDGEIAIAASRKWESTGPPGSSDVKIKAEGMCHVTGGFVREVFAEALPNSR